MIKPEDVELAEDLIPVAIDLDSKTIAWKVGKVKGSENDVVFLSKESKLKEMPSGANLILVASLLTMSAYTNWQFFKATRKRK